MTEINENIFGSILNFPPISRVRRNHGLEHATLHILAQRHPRTSMAGHSDLGGFWILGDVPTEDVQSAVDEALTRMKAGEKDLAVHPNCGTNFVTAGTMAGLAAWFALFGSGRRLRDRLERIPLATSLATVALILAQPVGLTLQAHVTTSGNPGNLNVIDVIPSNQGRIPAHRVITEG
ncbi:MAG: DUF6391 domain-containing protein [Anaerolineales bacterium]|jgi:hypothetical protein